MNFINRLLILLLALTGPLFSTAQIDDIGLWMGVSLEKQITRNASIAIGEQLRLKNDVSRIDVLLTDVGLEYSFSKKFKAGFHYRFINSNQDNYYSKRHRLYVNIAYKEKIDIVSLTLRGRLQEQYNDVNSSETGKIPVWTWRTKLTAKFDLNKKYFPYVASEIYYLIDNASEIDQLFTRMRYEGGFSYEFNRIHSVNPFVLLQSSLLGDFDELIYGITYEIYL